MNTNDKIQLAKRATTFVVGRSVQFVIASAAQNLAPAETKIQKIEVHVGAFVLGSMVADKAKTYTDEKLEELHNSWTEFKSKNTK